jgi:hypothetical protein
VAGHLLALDDFSQHNGQAYVLAGPEDVTGNEIVKLIEDAVGVKVDKVEFRNTDFLEELGQKGVIPIKVRTVSYLPLTISDKQFVRPMIAGMGGLWDGSSSLAKVGTDHAIATLAAPHRTVRDDFELMLAE